MKKITSMIVFGAITVICTTLVYAVPVELLSSSYRLQGGWRYQLYPPSWPLVGALFGTGSIEEMAVNVPSHGLYVTPTLPSNRTAPDYQSWISAEIKRFGLDYNGDGGPDMWNYSYDSSDGTRWDYYDGIDMQIDALWRFRPVTSRLSLNLQYAYQDRYQEDTQFVVRLFDKTQPFQLLEYDIPLTYWGTEDANFNFPVNIQHEYELILCGSGYAGNFTLTELALAVDLQSIPEPTTMLLLGLGLMGLAGIRRKLSI